MEIPVNDMTARAAGNRRIHRIGRGKQNVPLDNMVPVSFFYVHFSSLTNRTSVNKKGNPKKGETID